METTRTNNKKAWNEYFTEFLMLFLAVTFGFFAENYREAGLERESMKENYIALLLDLEQDRKRIKIIFDSTTKYEYRFLELKYVLFQYHSGEIGWEQLKNKYMTIGTMPNYSTLFINNMTFKNMQSSGLVSGINDQDLKSQLSYYYEVIFKRLEDNNHIFDNLGVEFNNKHRPNTNLYEAIMKNRNDSLLNSYPPEFSNNANYKKFIMELPETKARLTNGSLVFELNNYSSRYFSYHNILKDIEQQNLQLKQKIEKELENY